MVDKHLDHWEKDGLYHKWCQGKNEVRYLLHIISKTQKISFKWIKDLNVKKQNCKNVYCKKI